MNVLTAILESFRWAANYNSHELAAPTVILWPDEERLWTQSIDALRAKLPFAVDARRLRSRKVGPAVWLRYQIETQQGADIPGDLSSRHRALRLPQRGPMSKAADASFCTAIPGAVLDAKRTEKIGRPLRSYRVTMVASGLMSPPTRRRRRLSRNACGPF